MTWILGLILAFVFIKLGMLIVLVRLLGIAFQLALLVIVVMAVAIIWRKWIEPKLRGPKVFITKK